MGRAGAARVAWILAGFLAACGGGGGGDAGPGDAGFDGADPGGDAARCATAGDCTGLDAGPCGRVACSAAGLCEVVADPAREGGDCTPEDRCAVGQATCAAGACVPAGRKECPERPCLEGACDPATGECGYASVADGQACEAEGNPCTEDRCVGGTCVAGANTCPCTGDGDCPPPADRCLGALRCDGTAGCVTDPARAVACAAPDGPCRTNACNPETGACQAGSAPDGQACGTADLCLASGQCRSGDCQQEPKCDDGDPCTADACDPATGACSHASREGESCDDGSACTAGDTCQGGQCVPGPGLPCDDGNPCTDDACDPASGCTFPPAAAGGACDDGDPCTGDDTCGPGGTCSGTERDCDDGNPCTADACDGATGQCLHDPRDGEACEDGNDCTAGDRCAGTACTAGAWRLHCCNGAADCDDGDACTAEACQDGLCRYDGEAAGTCGAGAGCGGAWCDAAEGTCGDLDLRLPRRLLAWDLRDGGAAPGFRWGDRAGTRTGEGLGEDPTGAAATFRLPGRRVPRGVTLLELDLGTGTCQGVAASRGGGVLAPAACGSREGRARAAWSFLSDGSPLDLSVTVQPGTRVAALDLTAWASPDCMPLGPVLLAPGKGYSDLAAAGNDDRVSLAAKMELDVVHVGYDFDKGLLSKQTVSSEPLETQQNRFEIQLISAADGQPALLAYGGTDKHIVAATLDESGAVIKRSVFSAMVLSIADYRFEPALARSPDAEKVWIAWSLSREASPDLEIGLTWGGVADGVPTWEPSGNLMNLEGTGVQRRPRLTTFPGGGVTGWISEPDASASHVVLRRVEANGLPGIDEVKVNSAAEPLRELALASLDGAVAWVAERDGGVVQGGLRKPSDLTALSSLAFPAGPVLRRYAPDLAAVSGGAMLVFSGVDSGSTRVFRTWLQSDGTLGAEVPVSPSIDRTEASPAVASLGTWWSAMAWYDGTDQRPSGLYLALAAPGCDDGPVRCDGPAPEVCTGLGPDPYLALPSATGWCP